MKINYIKVEVPKSKWRSTVTLNLEWITSSWIQNCKLQCIQHHIILYYAYKSHSALPSIYDWPNNCIPQTILQPKCSTDLALFTNVALLSKPSRKRICTASNPFWNVKSNWKCNTCHLEYATHSIPNWQTTYEFHALLRIR